MDGRESLGGQAPQMIFFLEPRLPGACAFLCPVNIQTFSHVPIERRLLHEIVFKADNDHATFNGFCPEREVGNLSNNSRRCGLRLWQTFSFNSLYCDINCAFCNKRTCTRAVGTLSFQNMLSLTKYRPILLIRSNFAILMSVITQVV